MLDEEAVAAMGAARGVTPPERSRAVAGVEQGARARGEEGGARPSMLDEEAATARGEGRRVERGR